MQDGIVVIGHNDDLCYVGDINWGRLFEKTGQRTSIKFNKPAAQCGELVLKHHYISSSESYPFTLDIGSTCTGVYIFYGPVQNFMLLPR